MNLRIPAAVLAALAAFAVIVGPYAALVIVFVLAVAAAGGMTALIARRILADLTPTEAFP